MNDTGDNYERVIALMTSRPDIHIPARAHIDPRMTGALMRVYTSMCWHKNIDHVCWPSQTFLAAELGITQQAVSKSIRQLIAFGYVEILRRGFHGTGQTHVYRVITEFPSENLMEKYSSIFRHSENTGASAQGARPESSHLQPEVVSIYNPTLSHLQPEVVQKNTREEYQRRTSSEVTLLPTSLAHRADIEPPTVTAPPERRTRESEGKMFDATALRRDPLYIALAQYLPEPSTYSGKREWAVCISRMHRAQISAADIPHAVAGYGLVFPQAIMTIRALEKHWSLIREGKTREQLQLANARRSEEVRRAQKATDAAAEQLRRAEQQAEVDRLIREITDPAGASEPRHR